MMPPTERFRCPAFVGEDSRDGRSFVFHSEPCPFIHPFDPEWNSAGNPDTATIEEYHRAHPIRRAARTAEQQIMQDIFGDEEEDEEPNDDPKGKGPARSSLRTFPTWQDLAPQTVNNNLAAVNTALALVDLPIIEVQMDGVVPGEGPSLSFSSTGAATYPHPHQYSRPHTNLPLPFEQLWPVIEANAQMQRDIAQGNVQLRAAGYVAGRVLTRPVAGPSRLTIVTGSTTQQPSLLSPGSPTKRKREFSAMIPPELKQELSGSALAPSAKRPRIGDSPDLEPSVGEQLRKWRALLQPLMKSEIRQTYTRDKMRELSKVLEQLEEAKDDISRDLLGKMVERGGTKVGLVTAKIGQIEDMPFEDMFHIRQRAANLAQFWAGKFGRELSEPG